MGELLSSGWRLWRDVLDGFLIQISSRVQILDHRNISLIDKEVDS